MRTGQNFLSLKPKFMDSDAAIEWKEAESDLGFLRSFAKIGTHFENKCQSLLRKL